MSERLRNAEIAGQVDYLRGRDWFDPSASDASVTIVGCGGIGSPLGLCLAKLGIPHLTLIDADTVEKHNLPNQFFSMASLGQPKVEALATVIGRFSPVSVEPIQGFLGTLSDGSGCIAELDSEGVVSETYPYAPSGLVVSGLDSMDARMEVWDTVRNNPHVPFYLDCRIGGENVVLYAVDPRDPEDIERYEATLHSSSESVPLPCTRRSIIDVGFVVASMATRAVRRYLAGEPMEKTVVWNQETLRSDVLR